MLSIIVLGMGYGFAAAVQPGPFQTYLISQSLRQGWRRTLPASLAPLLSDGPIILLPIILLPIILLAILVLSQLPAMWEHALHIAGGLYVLYLAWGAFKAWREQGMPDAKDAMVRADHGLVKAALTNVLGPGPYLFWGMVTGPILLQGWREAPIRGVGFLLGFYAAMIASLVVLIVAFSSARRLGPRVIRVLVGLSALALLAFGLLQLAQGVLSI